MRIEPATLLVLIAILIPFIVQLRTVAGFIGVELSVQLHAAIGVFIIGALVMWALMPANGTATRTPDEGHE